MPVTKQSMRPGDQQTQLIGDSNIPDLFCQPTQLPVVSQLLDQHPESVPITKRSNRFGAQLQTPTHDSPIPPRDSHPPQLFPSHHLWKIALFVPKPNMSIRLLPHDTAVGRVLNVPPRDSHPPQLWPSHHLCQQA